MLTLRAPGPLIFYLIILPHSYFSFIKAFTRAAPANNIMNIKGNAAASEMV